MTSHSRGVGPSKRNAIVITDEAPEGSSSNQPVKREVYPDPSPQVVELQQQVSNLEDKFQRACRAAREAELKLEAAEARLDTKDLIVNSIDDVTLENVELKTQLAAKDERIAELTLKLAQYTAASQPQKKRRPSRKVAKNTQNVEDSDGNDFSTSVEVKRRPQRTAARSVKYTEEVEDEAPRTMSLAYYCDGCGGQTSSATGRFKCRECADFDLCRACKDKGEHSDVQHTLEEMKKYWT